MDREEMARTARYGLSYPRKNSARALLRSALGTWALGFLLLTFAPRLWARTLQPAHRDARGVLKAVARQMVLMELLGVVFRWLARGALKMEDLRDRLRADLGREPDQDEVLEAWMREAGFERPESAAPS